MMVKIQKNEISEVIIKQFILTNKNEKTIQIMKQNWKNNSK